MEFYKKHISDLGNIVTGKTPRTSIHENYGGSIPFLTPTDDLSGKYVPRTIKTLTEKGLMEVKNCLLPSHSVCVSCIGSDLGKVVLTTEPTITNQQFNSIIPNKDNDVDFIYYLMSIVGRRLNILSKTSTAVPIINKSTFSDYEIEIPDIINQRKIATILSSLDEKIETNRRINDNLEQQAKTLFKAWFVNYEPFKNGAFVDSELGLIPEGWSVKQLGDITTQQADKVKNRSDVKVLSPITTGKLVLSEEYFTKQVFSESISKYIVVKPLDFAYNTARVNIGSMGMNEFDFDGCVSPVYVVFRCENEYQYYFDLFRQTDIFNEEVKTRAIGGVRQSLTYKDFSLIKTVYPPIEVVREFNQIYSKIISQIKNNNEAIECLASIRDELLPKLMTGEIKVDNIVM